MNENIKNLHSLAMLERQDEETAREFEKRLSFFTLPRNGEGDLCPKAKKATVREDTVGKSMDRNILLSLAPAVSEGCVVLPRALKGEKE